MHYLYRITNALDNKIYIGQSNKENERWRQHKYFAKNPEKTGQYIHRAMAKHGVENFIYEVIAVCKTQEDADQTEAQLIKRYDSRNPNVGYNIAPGGESAWNKGLPPDMQPMYGRIVSEETRKKISESNMGKIMPPHTDEWKTHMSKIMTGRTISSEEIEKRALSNRGKKRTKESRKKMSLSHIGIQSGENHPKSKLNWEKVSNIRTDYMTGNYTYKQLGQKYGVSSSNISDVVNYKIWKP